MGAYVNLGSFYLVGIPTALVLGFVLKMEAKGLWMGISCGSIVQFLLLAVITFFSNWEKMVSAFYKQTYASLFSPNQHCAQKKVICFRLCSLRRQGREFSAMMSRQIRELRIPMDRVLF